MTDSLYPSLIARALGKRASTAAASLALLLAACGGGGGTSPSDPANAQADAGTNVEAAQAGPPVGTTHADAFRLLTQATFGPTDADISRVMSMGAAAWIDQQLALPAKAAHLARWNADDAQLRALNPTKGAGSGAVTSSVYQQGMTATDSLRQRVVLALSEIFVVSTVDLGASQGQAVASFLDMLGQNAFGTYRNLLQNVTLHPAMGLYLSALKNQKENPTTGRVPDQNYAREVMQLLSIGLVQLNPDGTPRLDANGAPIATYTPDDIVGLSRVFTGFSWGGADTTPARFFGAQPAYQDPKRMSLPMQAYTAFHSTSAKTFLGATVPAGVSDPMASLKVAMDTLAAHPNVGPFLSRQLIQRLVTSQPSAAYVGRVAAVFNNNGAGVRGDLKAVVRAILLDTEARDPALATGATYGKLREPILRLSAYLRAFNATSDSGLYLVTATDDPGTQLAQTPLASTTVFNFFRPGFVPSSGAAGALGMTVPEMEITNETSVAGYANWMIDAVARGTGSRGLNGQAARLDVQPNYTASLALADQPAALVDQVCGRLLGDNVSAGLKSQITAAVTSIVVPAPNKAGTNQNAIDTARRNRVQAAVLLALVSPEFIVQK